MGRHAGRVVDHPPAAQLLQELPLGRVAEVLDRKAHRTRIAHPYVELVGRHVAHERLVLDHLHGWIALAQVGHNERCLTVSSGHFLGFEQGRAVSELALDVLGLGIGR